MIFEFLQYVLTPAPRHVRAMGLLSEFIAIERRFQRCHGQWRGHLAQSQDAISAAVSDLDARGHAVILGAGWLLDVPLEMLAREFDRVTLVDIIVPAAVRRRIKAFPNVEAVVYDVSGYLQPLYAARGVAETPPLPLEPELPEIFKNADLVVSLNLLSQLPLAPERFIGRHWPAFPEDCVQNIMRSIVDRHLSWLRACSGQVLVISDTARGLRDAHRDIACEDLLYGRRLPAPASEWDWHIGPKGEAHPDFDLFHKVGVFTQI